MEGEQPRGIGKSVTLYYQPCHVIGHHLRRRSAAFGLAARLKDKGVALPLGSYKLVNLVHHSSKISRSLELPGRLPI